MSAEQKILSVSQVNQYIKTLFDGNAGLSSVFVRGELSNYKMYPSGHHYFSMKDEEGTLRCVMFRREASHLRFRPENGMKVIALGRVTVFPRDGQYQLYCNELTPDGVGALHVAFEQLKAKLLGEGLFDGSHKKPIPRYPSRIALITSSAGAAVQDMLRILGARWPMSQVAILPVRVQGTEAPGEIAAAIAWANAHQVADVIITGRGGGAMEDLWAFNEQQVARAIYASHIPVISAVGHEPDVTIADFVADLRAATPSNGAELAVPDQNEVLAHLNQLKVRMAQATGRRLSVARGSLERWARSRALQSPIHQIQDRRVLLDYQRTRLARALGDVLARERQNTARLAAALDAMSPLKVLARGYAIAQDGAGAVIHSTRAVEVGDRLVVRVSDGSIDCQVTH